MKVTLVLIVYICGQFVVKSATDGFDSTLNYVKPKTNETIQRQAALDLIQRVLPKHGSKLFNVTINKNLGPKGKDTFRIVKTSHGIIQITGTSGVAAAWGFHHYLKYYCKLHISWETEQLNLPTSLPNVNLTITSNDRFRYYQNVCTTSYSFVWWNIKDWTKHIDWMAMNGFNLVLAFNGQEYIWQKIYKKLNLTNEEIDEHMAGPAFLSWSRMGNIRGWGGPLSKEWHARSMMLQKFILQRMRDLGITPVLPAFAGHVPKAFKRLFPRSSMTRMVTWNNFAEKYCCPYLIEPLDPLFKKIGSMFMNEQINEYGTDHIYNCDTFNEMLPSNNHPKYLAQISRSIFAAMSDVDPKAIWLLQGWLFLEQGFWTKELAKSFILAVPLGRMVILDLQSEQFPQYTRLESYFGQPFIWCMLHNFGGTLGMFGSAPRINTQVFAGRAFPNSTMIGTGLTPEGINQNYVIYDLMNEMAWRKKPANLSQWFTDYSIRRYGKEDKNATAAWQILKDTVYSFESIEKVRGKYVITRSPRLNIKTWFWYNTIDFMKAWDHLLQAADNLKNNTGYLHDLVDVTRQALQILGDTYHSNLAQAFKKKQVHVFQKLKTIFQQIFSDLELILASNEAFLLGRWLESAKQAANTTLEKHQFEQNARNQITLWGPNGEIKDYANKQWAGVVSHYFGPRWNIFLNAMNLSLVENSTFDEYFVSDRIFNEVELPFTLDRTVFPTEPRGNSISISKEIHKRWRNNVTMPQNKKSRHRRFRIDNV